MNSKSNLLDMLYPGAWVAIDYSIDISGVDVFQYTHHGIVSVASDGVYRVIHFSKPDSLQKRIVQETDIADFLQWGKPGSARVMDHVKRNGTPQEVLHRAQKLLGYAGYHILSNNCEHFVSECYTGSSESSQVIGIGKIIFVFSTIAAVASSVGAVVGLAVMKMGRK
jgi:hypothetical protein